MLTFYKLDTWSRESSTKFRLGDCLFDAEKLANDADPDKNGHGIVFMVLDLMHAHNFWYQMVNSVKILLYLVWTKFY